MRLTYEEDTIEKKPSRREVVPDFAKSSKGFIIELVKIVLISLAIIIPIRYFLFQPFYVRGASMEPNFFDSEYLIIDEITYRFSDPARGDVVVIHNPNKNSEFFIKRVIGLPGETIEIKNNFIIIYSTDNPQGLELNETYLADGVLTQGNRSITLSPDQYYLLGDNRGVSLDSRSFGPLEKKYIVGRAWLRVWPFNQWESFHSPTYNFSST